MTTIRSHVRFIFTHPTLGVHGFTSADFDHDPNVGLTNAQWYELLHEAPAALCNGVVDVDVSAFVIPVPEHEDTYALLYSGGIGTVANGQWSTITMTTRPRALTAKAPAVGDTLWTIVPEPYLRTWVDDWMNRGNQSAADFIAERATFTGLKKSSHA